MRLTIDLSDKHAYALMQACEVLARCGMGQFQSVADAVAFDADYDTGRAFENAAKSLLMPDLEPNGYWSISNDRVPKDCQRAWELYQSVRQAVAWAKLRASGRTTPEFWGNQYEDPFPVIGPVPTATATIEDVS
jgi:hypothetical protein